jgi:hypothetical protein
MNAIGIIYPHYCEALDVDITFLGHLVVLKAKFCHPKPKGANGTLVASLLNPTFLDQQMSFSCLTMKSNNHDALHPLPNYNLTTKLWG